MSAVSRFEDELNDVVGRFVVELAALARMGARALIIDALGSDHAGEGKLPKRAQGHAGVTPDAFRIGLASAVDAFQREWIMRALDEHGGNVSEAARRLRTTRAGLQRRMKRLKVRSPKARARS